MRDFTLKVEVKLSATGANGGIQYRSRLLHPAHGGSIANPLGKPLPANVTTMEQAVAAGITARTGSARWRAGWWRWRAARRRTRRRPGGRTWRARRGAPGGAAARGRSGRAWRRGAGAANGALVKSDGSTRLRRRPAAATPGGTPTGIPGR